MKKKNLWVLILAGVIALTSCSEKANQESSSNESIAENSSGSENISSSQVSENSSEEIIPTKNEDFYEYKSFEWIDDENIKVINGSNIKILGLDNNIKKEVNLDWGEHKEISNAVILGDKILALDEYNTIAAEIDGKWQIYNCAILDLNGNLIKNFPEFKFDFDNSSYIADGKAYPFDSIKFSYLDNVQSVDDRTAVLYSNIGLFLLDIETGKQTLIDDYLRFVDEHGKFSAYYGISNLFSDKGNGVYYLAYDDEKLANRGGHIYYADLKTGEKTLISQETYSNFFGSMHMPLLQKFNYDKEGNINGTEFYYIYQGEVKKLADVDSWGWCFNTLKTSNGIRFMIESRNAGYFNVDVYDVEKGEIVNQNTCTFKEEDGYSSISLVTVQGDIGNLNYIYSDNEKTYVYNEKTKEKRELPHYIKRWNNQGFFRNAEYFTEIKSTDQDDKNYIRICPIEVK